MTRLDDLLDFGPLLKAFATISLPKSLTLLGNFSKGVKIYHFLLKSFLGNFFKHLVIFSGHTDGHHICFDSRRNFLSQSGGFERRLLIQT